MVILILPVMGIIILCIELGAFFVVFAVATTIILS